MSVFELSVFSLSPVFLQQEVRACTQDSERNHLCVKGVSSGSVREPGWIHGDAEAVTECFERSSDRTWENVKFLPLGREKYCI